MLLGQDESYKSLKTHDQSSKTMFMIQAGSPNPGIWRPPLGRKCLVESMFEVKTFQIHHPEEHI